MSPYLLNHPTDNSLAALGLLISPLTTLMHNTRAITGAMLDAGIPFLPACAAMFLWVSATCP